MNLKSVALSVLATALLIPAAASAAEPMSASFERGFGEPAGAALYTSGVHAGEAADALTVAFNEALWTKQAAARPVSPAPLLASFERAFGESAGVQGVAAGVQAGEAADALTVAFNEALWTQQAPARPVSPAPLLASFERAFGESAGIRGVAAGVHAGEAADALTVAFNEALWTKQAPARYATSSPARQTKKN